jgi:hemerythrin-like domain-containing protein
LAAHATANPANWRHASFKEDAVPSKPSNRRSMPTLVVESLDDTHRDVVLHLERLKVLAASLVATPASEATHAQARELIDFFTGPSRQHNYDEERFAFPSLLAGSDAATHRVIERLREEHAWIELQWLDIETQLAAFVEGAVPRDAQALRRAVDDFAMLMHQHMELEESTIYVELRARADATSD